MAELTWWIQNMPQAWRNIAHPNPLHGYSDTRLGLGAVHGGQEIGGRWTPTKSTKQISILQLQAAFLLRKFTHQTSKQ